MSLSPEQFVEMAAFTCSEVQRAEKRAADRERRRIRRALMPLLREARKFCPPHDCGCINCEVTKMLEAATRAPRAKRRRGK